MSQERKSVVPGKISNKDMLDRITDIVKEQMDICVAASKESEKNATARILVLEAELKAAREQNEALLLINQGLKEANHELICLNTKFFEANKTLSDDTAVPPSPTTSPAPPPVIPPPPSPKPPCKAFSFPENIVTGTDKEYFDVLILSDSIYRHVGNICPKVKPTRYSPMLEMPKPKEKPAIYDHFEVAGLSVKKIVIPGARAPRLAAEVSTLMDTHTFGNIVVHCGANYIPPNKRRDDFELISRDKAILEINTLLSFIGDQFDGMVTYSPILPQVHTNYIWSINNMNQEITTFCVSRGFDFLVHGRAYQLDDGYGSINAEMFAQDGVHLATDGIAALKKTFDDYIQGLFKYELII